VEQFMGQVKIPSPPDILCVQQNGGTKRRIERAGSTATRFKRNVKNFDLADLFDDPQ